MLAKKLIGSLCAVLFVASASAHEFWLEPSQYRVAPNTAFEITIFVGEKFSGELRNYKPERARLYALYGPNGKTDVVGRAGAKSAYARTQDGGCYVAAYKSELSYIDLPAKKFTKYLKAEGLDAIIAERERRQESGTVGRERYFRCAKSLICAGDEAKLKDQDVGLPLEIKIESRSSSRSNRAIACTVELRDKPLKNAQIVAVKKGDADARHVARTDKNGRAKFELDQPGVWLITTICMERVENDERADWQSIWASITFELPESRDQ